MTALDAPERERVYPATRHGNDGRFTMSVVIEVANVLELHGYQSPEGLDYLELQDTLFTFLYGNIR